MSPPCAKTARNIDGPSHTARWCCGDATFAGVAFGQSATVKVNRISDAGVGEKIGEIVVEETRVGMSFKVEVTGLSAGEHGFHVHERGYCGPA